MKQADIDELISIPKLITEIRPVRGMRIEDNNQRRDLKLKSTDYDHRFSIFFRQHLDFYESFSIGMVYHAPDGKSIQLIRYNGKHGAVATKPLGEDTHIEFHIHYLTESDYEIGNYLTPSGIEITGEYITFEQAMGKFLRRVNVLNADQYFPNLDQLELFN